MVPRKQELADAPCGEVEDTLLELLSEPAFWTALLTLTVLEIVLGIDNIVFISILSDRLPEELRQRARTVGLLLAMFMRIALLFSIGWMMGLTEPLESMASLFAGWVRTSEDVFIIPARR